MQLEIIKKFNIITYQVTTPNQVIPIKYNIPKHFSNLKTIGVFCTEIGSEKIRQKNIGELSILINNKSEHVLHQFISPSHNEDSFKENELEVNTQIKEGSSVDGYFKDYNIALNEESEFLPYKLKIIFDHDKS